MGACPERGGIILDQRGEPCKFARGKKGGRDRWPKVREVSEGFHEDH